MQEIKVELGTRSYPIYIGAGLLSSKDLLGRTIDAAQVMVVTNTTIASLYLDQIMELISRERVESVTIPDGESYKTLDVMNDIITQLLEHKFSRDCCLVALGGGVVGDITGFAAACYQRGVKFIQIPTTLLAQVDSSVGGKTGVNHPLGKNMIGAFYQPQAVIADVKVLATLPDRELSAGLAEVIKYGLIRDEEFFCWLEENMARLVKREPKSLEYAIARSCINKAEVVAQDEKESGVRATLNFGHTFGHALETGLNYKEWLHGEAVAVGMVMAAELSNRHGWLEKTDVTRVKNLLIKAGLPVKLPPALRTVNMRELMAIDKKAKSGRLFLVLLKGIGSAVVTSEFHEELLQEVLTQFQDTPEAE